MAGSVGQDLYHPSPLAMLASVRGDKVQYLDDTCMLTNSGISCLGVILKFTVLKGIHISHCHSIIPNEVKSERKHFDIAVTKKPECFS